jgi:hypothetical protein
MTQEQSFRAAMQTPGSWQRFALIVPLMIAVGTREDLVRAMGFADTGAPHWISAAAVASAFVVYILLSVREPLWRPVADRPRVVRFAYAATYLLATGAFLLLVFAGQSFTNPFLWAAGALMLLMGLLDWLARPKRAESH